ncbi:glycosyltransferase [Fulvivirga sp. 29W222]|uniref:Glycosyltransferase n=1 Tax=Fulvivirga marina TaxID=2494733 RepID=A0A937FVI7_9BACT|nr:glycosyltransferase [Fulvivirga marina]MBL6445768.1 glycosyltransferase [Fulvivirga marina]
MKVDLLLVVDHLNVECGVRYTYLKFIEWCESAGITLALVSDLDHNLTFKSVRAQLNLVVRDSREGLVLKRRPLYALVEGEDVIHEDLLKGNIDYSDVEWLDAWNGDRGWYPDFFRKCEEFANSIEPAKVVIATQSFLGFVVESIYRDKDPAICLHTNYPSFYAIRIAGKENELFDYVEMNAQRRLHKHFINNKNNIFLNSDVSEGFFRIGEAFNYQIFTPGVDTSIFKPKLKRQNGTLKIMYVGRFSEEKGIDNISTLTTSTPFAQWILAGKVSNGQNLDFSKNTSFLGYLDHESLADEMAKADALVFYGKWDTFGMIALEALSCGLPVFATRGSEMGRIIQQYDCGWEFSSTPELIELIKTIQKDGIRTEVKKNAREYALNMTWKSTFGDFVSKLRL